MLVYMLVECVCICVFAYVCVCVRVCECVSVSSFASMLARRRFNG